MGNALRFLYGNCCKPTTAGGASATTGGVSALVHDIFQYESTSQVPDGLNQHVVSSKKAQANWYKKLLDAWKGAKSPPRTPQDATRFVVQTLKRHQKADVEGLLRYYGFPLPQDLDDVSPGAPTTSLPEGAKFELQTLPVDVKAIPDGDTITVYVSVTDPRESSCLPKDVQVAAAQRSKARAAKDYTKADALHKKIIDSGYRVIPVQNEEVLARKYRIRLRGIDAPESSMPYGKDAKEELVKLVQGKSLRVLVYDQDRYGRCVGDIYCNGKFIQEVLLKKGLAWHYSAYDHRSQLENWEKEARAKRVGLWASSNPQKPWEYRKDKRENRN